MPFCRASELDRLLTCNGSLLLPRDVFPIGIAAGWGNMCHRWMETGEFEDSRDGVALKRKIERTGVDRLTLWPATGKFEVTIAYNIETSKAVSLNLPAGMPIEQRIKERDAWKGIFNNEWIVGSADYVGNIFDLPWVDDFKTGRFAHWGDYRAQQSLYCLAINTLHSGLSDEIRSTITHWPRYPVAQKPKRHGVVLEPPYLKEFASRLKQLRKDVLNGKLNLNAGNHCYFCASKNNCSEYSLEKIYD